MARTACDNQHYPIRWLVQAALDKKLAPKAAMKGNGQAIPDSDGSCKGRRRVCRCHRAQLPMQPLVWLPTNTTGSGSRAPSRYSISARVKYLLTRFPCSCFRLKSEPGAGAEEAMMP